MTRGSDVLLCWRLFLLLRCHNTSCFGNAVLLGRLRLFYRLLLEHLLVTPRELDVAYHSNCGYGCHRVQTCVQNEHRPEALDVGVKYVLSNVGREAEICETGVGRGSARSEDSGVVDYLGDRRRSQVEGGHPRAEAVIDDRRSDSEGEGAAEKTNELFGHSVKSGYRVNITILTLRTAVTTDISRLETLACAATVVVCKVWSGEYISISH